MVQRFEQIINGREYVIEVALVGVNQWRAQLQRVHGGPSALMPFYGPTPDEAAGLLARWLTLANRHAGNQV